MKIWQQKTGKEFDLEIEQKYEIGDIELFPKGTGYIIVDPSEVVDYERGPEFGAIVCYSERRPDLAYEEIKDDIKVIKNTEVARRMNKGNIWKQNEKWLIVKL